MSQQHETNSLLQHLLLPCHLPSSAEKDFLLENEYELLKDFDDFLQEEKSFEEFGIIGKCVEKWLDCENARVEDLQSTFQQLENGDFFALYFHAQNAAILIEMDEKPLISAWEVQLPNKEITSSLKPHLSCFPLPQYRLNHRSQLTSRAHCELLIEFMENTIEHRQSRKSNEQFDEERDVPVSHYVTQWWIKQFPGVRLDNPKGIDRFTKKHRDHIRWEKTIIPFRRSGLWMTMKVVFQTILVKQFQNLGTIIYKLLITSFLVYLMDKLYDTIPLDLLVHGLRKIARRMKKIDQRFLQISPTEIHQQWIANTKQKIQEQMKRLLRTSDPLNTEPSSIPDFDLDNSKMYRHAFHDIKIRPSKSFFQPIQPISSTQIYTQIPSIEYLQNVLKYPVGDVLTYIEIWIESSLGAWLCTRRSKSFEILLEFFETYQTHALDHYRAKDDHPDSIGYSRFVLTSLTIIYYMHLVLCRDPRFPRFGDHSIRISNVFEYLILPYRQNMSRARELYDYFDQFRSKPYPSLLAEIDRADAFGVHFAERSESMKATLRAIRSECERDKQAKIEEVKRAKIEYQTLLDQANALTCQGFRSRRRKKCWCPKCELIKQAETLSVPIYECPIPAEDRSALAVVFELQMPMEIRCYREILWQFTNRPEPKPPLHMHEWLKMPQHKSKLERFYTGPRDINVKLVSSKYSLSQTHFSTPGSIATKPIEKFLFENSLDVQISPTKPLNAGSECQILTPSLSNGDYQSLQWTLSSTEFAQNGVIAQLSDCPPRIKPSQYIEFGSFRSGDSLQWWNLLAVFELESLPIENEDVVLLIIHSLYQYGPVSEQRFWSTDAHRILFDDNFVYELVSRLNHRLDQCEFNWQDEFVFIGITMIAVRILTLCNETKTDMAAQLIGRCRKIGERWIQLICESIKNSCSRNLNETDELRTKLVHIGIACQLTYSIDAQRVHYVLLTNDDLISLLRASTTVHDNCILLRDQTNASRFIGDLRRFSDRVLLAIQPEVHRLLRQLSFRSLNEFAKTYWAVLHDRDPVSTYWKKRTSNDYDGWYDCIYYQQLQANQISINCLTGTFLVNGMTVGFLPKTITAHQLFLRVFDQHIFEVQPHDTPNTYITKYTYHKEKNVQYTFQFDEHLIVFEIHQGTGERYQLISPDCFQKELPDVFTSNYSHWKNTRTNQIEFRPIRFNDPQFFIDRPYIFNLKSRFVTTTDQTRTLVPQSSEFFQCLYQHYFYRLDDEPYVYMMKDHPSRVFQICTSRLGLTFEYDTRTRVIASCEYPTMCVADEQNFGTLIGLQFGLLLSSTGGDQAYQCRKLIVPFGDVQAEKDPDTDEAVLTLERRLFQHQYFVYNLNDRLCIIQSTDSPTGWLYLALLHALTSRLFTDSYTRMTGMERAFQLLKSAGCWNDQPYEELSLNILFQIAKISPQVDYYPPRLRSKVMEKVHWRSRVLPYSMQHFGYYLFAQKLIDTSEQLKFMYSTSTETSKLPKNNLQLLRKLYWDYRDSYNPAARLPKEMEDEILESFSDQPYQSTSTDHSCQTDYSRIDLVDGLYRDGDVNLLDVPQLDYFPLSKWLEPDHNLKNSWIGLLKKVLSMRTNDEIKRFEIFLHFLHYISSQTELQPFFLQLLRTVLKHPDLISRSIVFPRFGTYNKIEQIFVQVDQIPFQSNHTEEQRSNIMSKIEHCLEYRSLFSLHDPGEITIDTAEIDRLLSKWRSNRELRFFFQTIQNLIYNRRIEPLNASVSIESQRFTLERIRDHHQLKLTPSARSIDSNLLSICRRNFCYRSSDDLVESTTINKRTRRQNSFPHQIFPSDDPRENPLSNIAKHFKTQLHDSWQEFLSITPEKKEYPSSETIQNTLHSSRLQSAQIWKELQRSIRSPNEFLFRIGVLTRIIPTNLISVLLAIWSNRTEQFDIHLNGDQCILLGGLIVNWIFEQQLERALHKPEDFEKELSNPPHTNWIPSKHLPWLILELEMNITIREIQVDVARHMMQDYQSVMQMNMGEGKTSVIIPMLAVQLESVRLIVLKSLFTINYQSLKYKLGGLLNRRIFPFICRRQMSFSQQQLDQIFIRLKTLDVILTSPEYVLSFDLLTIDRCRRKEYELARSMLTIYKWMRTHLRDILDESDEILHVKYQLIYTIGHQQSIDGGAERWIIIQKVLLFVKKYAEDIAKDFPRDTFYKPSKRQSTFPELRLLSTKPYSNLCKKIIQAWFDEEQHEEFDRERCSSFILSTNSSIDDATHPFPSHIIQLLLILRGFLSFEVLFLALKKRYRVNYGINSNAHFNRLMAVPFRAKDIPAENTEFGHSDLAIVLTQFSYYYSGLSDSQLNQCLTRLKQEENEPSEIYDTWILFDDPTGIDASVRNWNGVNVKDSNQRTNHLYPVLRGNMLVIDYFLNHFVYPHEAKQFPEKYIASGWDLASSVRSRVVTGFSGTNDTQLLLPVHICQRDLPHLKQTDALVLNNLLQLEKDNYRSLEMDITSEEILRRVVRNQSMINVILDVGALLIDQTNRQIAEKWLKLSDKNRIDYAIYFESDSILVCDRRFHHQPFLTSPASERLDRSVIYLDEIHTRGSDFKFPRGFQAVLTLGVDLTKDRFVQAAMRMRQLGNGHSLTFWSSNEVDQQIRKLKNDRTNINLFDILRWVYENTQQATWNGLHHWAIQSLNFQRKIAAFQSIGWDDLSNGMMGDLARNCLEPEIIDLKHLYGSERQFQTLDEIYRSRRKTKSDLNVHQEVSKRLREYSGSKKRLTQLFDEEQERELEQEIEEQRQIERPGIAEPCQPILHPEIRSLCDKQGPIMNLAAKSQVFRPLVHAFQGTTIYDRCQVMHWKKNLWITTEFQRVIEDEGESLDSFLRPPRWIVVYRKEHLIFLSPFEANCLMKKITSNSLNTTLRLLLPRRKRIQSILINESNLINPSYLVPEFSIPLEWLVQLFIFNGTLYFENRNEQQAYYQCFSRSNSLKRMLKKLLEIRNHSFAPLTSPVGRLFE